MIGLVKPCINSLLRLHIRKLNNAAKCTWNLHNFSQAKNILIYYCLSNKQSLQIKFLQQNNFSTTNITLSKSKNKGKEKKKTETVHISSDDLEAVLDVDAMKLDFEKVLGHYKNDLFKHTALRTSVGAIEELTVQFEGKEYKLQEVVEINRQPKLITLNVSIFPQLVNDVLNAVRKSQMNLNPQQDGTTIYIQIPKVTKEYRENLAKSAKSFFNKCKDNITDTRNKYVKAVRKEENISTELVFEVEKYITIVSREYINNAEKLLQSKQKELTGEL